MKSHQKFAYGLLIVIAFVGLFGLTSYFVNNNPKAQKTIEPNLVSSPTSKLIKTLSVNKTDVSRSVLEKQYLNYEIARLKSKLKKSEATYKDLNQKYDSVCRMVNETLLKRPQKAESGKK